MSKPSVLDAKLNPSRYTEQKFKQDALVGEYNDLGQQRVTLWSCHLPLRSHNPPAQLMCFEVLGIRLRGRV